MADFSPLENFVYERGLELSENLKRVHTVPYLRGQIQRHHERWEKEKHLIFQTVLRN
jgi:hypothetical protein